MKKSTILLVGAGTEALATRLLTLAAKHRFEIVTVNNTDDPRIEELGIDTTHLKQLPTESVILIDDEAAICINEDFIDMKERPMVIEPVKAAMTLPAIEQLRPVKERYVNPHPHIPPGKFKRFKPR